MSPSSDKPNHDSKSTDACGTERHEPEEAGEWLKCPECSYDLRGLPEHRCPECGTPFDPEELRFRPQQIRRWQRRITVLMMGHIFLSGLVLLTLILPYHISGRAAYDYGLDVPGKGKYGYDPKYNPPYTWPVIGPILRWGSFVLVFAGYTIISAPRTMLSPPVGLLYTRPFMCMSFLIGLSIMGIIIFGVPALVYVYRTRIPKRRLLAIGTLWVIGCLPHCYIFVNGYNVFDWWFD